MKPSKVYVNPWQSRYSQYKNITKIRTTYNTRGVLAALRARVLRAPVFLNRYVLSSQKEQGGKKMSNISYCSCDD
jgi:hypothetical protein